MQLTQEQIDPAALLTRVEQLIQQGRPGAARPLLAAARGLVEPSAGISILAARLALGEGLLDSAGAELDRALTLEPAHAGLRRWRAEVRRQLGDLEGATRDAAEAVIGDRHDPACKALLGELLFDLGRPDNAVTCLAEAVAASPYDAAYREALAQSLAAAGDMDGAMETLRDGIALNPGSTAIRNAAILMCIRRRDFVQAEQLAEQSRIAGVADANTFGLKGHALSSLNRHADAARAYNEALKLAPGDTYVRHLAAAAGIAASAIPGLIPPGPAAPDAYVRALFDGYSDRFETHLVSLGYRIPGLIRRHAALFAAEQPIGGFLDLGCGTGLAALALSDLDLGPAAGIDLSPGMLDQARAKGLYDELTEGPLPNVLTAETRTWRLIVAADVLCYFGALEPMLAAVHARLPPGGRFIFSVEELLPDHDGNTPGNGDWALGRQGRYAHEASYVTDAAEALGFRCLTLDRETLRFEAGGPVAGLILVLERPRCDA